MIAKPANYHSNNKDAGQPVFLHDLVSTEGIFTYNIYKGHLFMTSYHFLDHERSSTCKQEIHLSSLCEMVIWSSACVGICDN